MNFDKDELSSYIKGALAEKLFELIHLELKCQVYRTGHEHLFPHIFQIANTKKKVSYIKDHKRDMEEFPDNVIQDLKFSKDVTGKMLSSSPDFTIISESGVIAQFEVKYRRTGFMFEQDLERYTEFPIKPNIFLFSLNEPHIKILHYTKEKGYYEWERKDDGSIDFFDFDKNVFLPSDALVYSKDLIDKYSSLIKEWFK